VILRRVRITILDVEKKYVLHIFSVSVASLVQDAQHMRHILLISVGCLALPNFSTLPLKRHDFWKNVLNIKCVYRFFFQLV